MKECPNCHAKFSIDVTYCTSCGADEVSSVDSPADSVRENKRNSGKSAAIIHERINKIKQIDSENLHGLFAYLGLLIVFPMMGSKRSDFLRFHTNQGIGLIFLELVFAIISILLFQIKVTVNQNLHGEVYGPGHAGSLVTPWYVWVIFTVFVIITVLYKYLGIRSALASKKERFFLISAFNGISSDLH